MCASITEDRHTRCSLVPEVYTHFKCSELAQGVDTKNVLISMKRNVVCSKAECANPQYAGPFIVHHQQEENSFEPSSVQQSKVSKIRY